VAQSPTVADLRTDPFAAPPMLIEGEIQKLPSSRFDVVLERAKAISQA
jgi:hypothetical protein